MTLRKREGAFLSSASLLCIAPAALYWVVAAIASYGGEPAETALRAIPDPGAVVFIFALPALALVLGVLAYLRRERLARSLAATLCGAAALFLAALGAMPIEL
jgi:hypothetical protein